MRCADLLDAGPHDQLPEYMLDLDTVVSEEVTSYSTDVFVVWEYRGPLDRDEIEDIMRELMRTEEGDEPVSIEVDPLIQADAVLFFCQGEMLKYGITHMDDNSPIYSIYQMEKSTARLWSVGLPFLIREQAAILIDAWRGMLDNAALAAQPQIEINYGDHPAARRCTSHHRTWSYLGTHGGCWRSARADLPPSADPPRAVREYHRTRAALCGYGDEHLGPCCG